MYTLDSVIEELIGETPRGHTVNAMLLCPLHDEDTPSFSIHREEGLWQCFGCGQKGGIEKLARLVGEELGEHTRQDLLIRSLNMDEAPVSRRNFAPLANQYLAEGKGKRGQAAISAFLGKRGLPGSIASAYGVGFSESRGCIAFPYWDDGLVSGIKYRAANGAKFAEDRSEFGLYGVEFARGREKVFIFEGESDTLQGYSRLVGEGEEPPGCCGTSGAVKSRPLWERWALDLIFAREVFIVYDADDAGDQAFEVAAKVLGSKAIRLRPTRGKDFTEYVLAGGTLDELMARRND
jgi:DNA primase